MWMLIAMREGTVYSGVARNRKKRVAVWLMY